MEQDGNYLPKVRDQYEQYPYPERDPEDERKRLIVSHRARLDAVNQHCFKGQQDFERGFRVLTAGGGTGDALIAWAEQLRNKRAARVTYLDMSTASAAVARQRAKVRDLHNIDWIDDSLLNLPNLDVEPFDFIDCAGVLHHLQDPDEGLKALASVLKPGGAMSLMVYGTYGRTGIYQVQNLMRMINGEDDRAAVQIDNTRKVLRSLAPHHWFNAGQRMPRAAFNDLDNDAGMFDLFLHTRDRSYSILEVHDWLARCGMQMTSEPGTNYHQLQYLPETFVQDPGLLARIAAYPRHQRQAIGEALSGEIAKHEFYAVPAGAPDTVARLDDEGMVPWAGIGHVVPLKQLADLAASRHETFTVTVDHYPDKPRVVVATGRFVADILRAIDGERTVEQILAVVTDKHPDATREAIMDDFRKLFVAMSRGHMLHLRHQSVSAFTAIHELSGRGWPAPKP